MAWYADEGAGLLLIARATGRALLLLRSDDVLQPGTWGIPGGRVDEGEAPREAAVRELGEEVGYDGEVEVSEKPLLVYEAEGFRYSTFVAFVDDEFEPELNWEHTEARWFALDDLPTPLHFGVADLFKKGRATIDFLVGAFKQPSGPTAAMAKVATLILAEYMPKKIASDVAGNALVVTVYGTPPSEAIEETIRHRLANPGATRGGGFPRLTEAQITEISERIEDDEKIAEIFESMEGS